jgi:hypothetical protein
MSAKQLAHGPTNNPGQTGALAAQDPVSIGAIKAQHDPTGSRKPLF